MEVFALQLRVATSEEAVTMPPVMKPAFHKLVTGGGGGGNGNGGSGEGGGDGGLGDGGGDDGCEGGIHEMRRLSETVSASSRKSVVPQ